MQARTKTQSLMLPDVALANRVKKMTPKELEDLPLRDLIQLVALTARAVPHLLKAEALALGDVTDRPVSTPVEPAPEQDALAKKIQESDELRAIAATLIQRASYGDDGGGPRPDPAGGVCSTDQ